MGANETHDDLGRQTLLDAIMASATRLLQRPSRLGNVASIRC